MTTVLIYGRDSVGKSVQVRAVCEMASEPIVISLEPKNRRLYGLDEMGKPTEATPFEVVEPLILEPAPSFAIVEVESFNAFGKVVERILNGLGPDGKPKKYSLVVIDGISDLTKWAGAVVLKEIQKQHPERKAIGMENLAAWAARNNLANLPLERLATWAEITGATVIFTTLMKPEYINNARSGYTIAVQDRIKEKASDVRICLEKDGRGYIATFEKVPDGADIGPARIPVGKGGIAVELAKRGLL